MDKIELIKKSILADKLKIRELDCECMIKTSMIQAHIRGLKKALEVEENK